MQMRAEFIPLPVSVILHRSAHCAETYSHLQECVCVVYISNFNFLAMCKRLQGTVCTVSRSYLFDESGTLFVTVHLIDML